MTEIKRNLRVYRIILDQDRAQAYRWTWIIKEAVGNRNSRLVETSMGRFLGYWVFPTAREAFENALDVLTALEAKPRHDGEAEYRPVNKQVIDAR